MKFTTQTLSDLWLCPVFCAFAGDRMRARGAQRMGPIKSLWAMVQGDPVFMRRVNGWLAIAWLLMIPVSIEAHWLDKVQYVSALSIWALVSGHWSAWQAARVEVNQQQEMEAAAEEQGRPSLAQPAAPEANPAAG